jgi:hypothetical protein
MDDLMASLNKQAKVKDSPHHHHASSTGSRNSQPTDLPSGSADPPKERRSKSFNPSDSFSRKGFAKMRFSPRDLRVASATGDHELVQQYIEHTPAFLDKQDKNGWTSLHFASRSGRTEVVRILLEHGCDLEVVDKEGRTALDVVRRQLGDEHPTTILLRQATITGVGEAIIAEDEEAELLETGEKSEVEQKAEEEAIRRWEEQVRLEKEDALRTEEEARRRRKEARKRRDEARKRAEDDVRRLEEDLRRKAEKEARRLEEEAYWRAEEEARKREEAQLLEEEEAMKREKARLRAEDDLRRLEEDLRRKAEKEARRLEEEEAYRRAEEEARQRQEEEAHRQVGVEARRLEEARRDEL